MRRIGSSVSSTIPDVRRRSRLSDAPEPWQRVVHRGGSERGNVSFSRAWGNGRACFLPGDSSGSSSSNWERGQGTSGPLTSIARRSKKKEKKQGKKCASSPPLPILDALRCQRLSERASEGIPDGRYRAGPSRQAKKGSPRKRARKRRGAGGSNRRSCEYLPNAGVREMSARKTQQTHGDGRSDGRNNK